MYPLEKLKVSYEEYDMLSKTVIFNIISVSVCLYINAINAYPNNQSSKSKSQPDSINAVYQKIYLYNAKLMQSSNAQKNNFLEMPVDTHIKKNIASFPTPSHLAPKAGTSSVVVNGRLIPDKSLPTLDRTFENPNTAPPEYPF